MQGFSPRLKAKVIAREVVNFEELLDPKKKAKSNKLSLKTSDEVSSSDRKGPGCGFLYPACKVNKVNSGTG